MHPRRQPDTDPTLAPSPTSIKRFWANVVRGPDNEPGSIGSCWIWIGPISTPDGYGRFTWQVNMKRRTMSAHRFALLLHTGEELPPGRIGEHACCEPLCVRVHERHLRTSTQSENIDYAVFRGRHNGSRPGAGSHLRAQRSLRIRDAVRHGWNEDALTAARAGTIDNPDQIPLW